MRTYKRFEVSAQFTSKLRRLRSISWCLACSSFRRTTSATVFAASDGSILYPAPTSHQLLSLSDRGERITVGSERIEAVMARESRREDRVAQPVCFP
jgi:hypothetical protein